MKYVSRLLFLLVALMAMTNCGQRNGTPITETDELVKQNSMYYWKTTFDIDSTDVAFLETHNIKRLYVRMFDVATEQDFLNGTAEICLLYTSDAADE